ncbi:MAG: pyridoxal phosphate-dependent decarboxylase family protein [Acidobacteriota bacterium]
MVRKGRLESGFSPDRVRADLSLELSGQQMRAMVDQAMDRIVSHLMSLASQPAGYDPTQVEPGPVNRELPTESTDLDTLLGWLFQEAIPASFNTAGPGYLAYIPGGGLFESAVADLISGSVNRYVGVWAAAPLLVRLEQEVMAWFARMMGLPPTARGILTTGGSMANFTALVTARRERLPENFLRGVIYTSTEAHHSVAKAALLAGFPASSVVRLPTDEMFRMGSGDLGRAVQEDRARGRTPFLVVACAGTTNTGAVDHLESLADLCAREDLWLHVDAAYGGFFQLTAAGQAILQGISRADSITLDPHKGLFLPYGTGALLVRDGEALRRAHSLSAVYMPALQDDEEGERVDFSEHGMELSRAFRGLRVWLPLKLHGVAPFIANLEEKMALARQAAQALERMDGIEIVAAPQLSTVVFRLVRSGLSPEELNGLNQRLLEAVLSRQRVLLTSTRLAGRLVIRICVLGVRPHADRIEECLEIIRAEAARL